METWHFGIDNDRLVNLVLSGKKKATTSLYDLDRLPIIGGQSILIYDNEKKACITETREIIVTEFENITWDLASLEGENTSLKDWQKVHSDYFKTIMPSFNRKTKVILEIFKVTENLVTQRLKTAEKIYKRYKH